MSNDVNSGLAAIITEESLRALAGSRSYGRGRTYAADGSVRRLAEYAGEVTAQVVGTRVYTTTLRNADGELDYDCDCPVGRDGSFCKHCVAVGLVWLEQGERDGVVQEEAPAITMEDVRAYLEQWDVQDLLNLLMEQAMESPELRERLLLQAAGEAPASVAVATYRQAIDRAVQVCDFVPYQEAYGYAQGIHSVLDSIEELLGEHAAEAMDLCEHAMTAVEEVVGCVDDSDGEMGGVCQRLSDIHRAVCLAARPDPEALARRLFERGMNSEWFSVSPDEYADALGRKGLAVYRKLAEAEWARLPALGPGHRDGRYDGRRYRITQLMEALARQSGDLEALVAVKSRDLSAPWDYLQIANLYHEAGEADKALDWAERGAAAFPDAPDYRLQEFLADEYHRRGRHADAMALIWQEFISRPDLHQYMNLQPHAEHSAEWPVWRDRALAHIRERIANERADAPGGGRRFGRYIDNSELVRIFLWEGDVDQAWREAQDGGCETALWLKLAEKREDGHPEDALPILQRHIEVTVNHKNNGAYAEAVELLHRVNGILARLGRSDEFEEYLRAVRFTHKPKRNFMKLLDSARWKKSGG